MRYVVELVLRQQLLDLRQVLVVDVLEANHVSEDDHSAWVTKTLTIFGRLDIFIIVDNATASSPYADRAFGRLLPLALPLYSPFYFLDH